MYQEHDFGDTAQLLNNEIKKLPQSSIKEFIKETLDCITNAFKNNPEKLCSMHQFGEGDVIGEEGTFLLETCRNLIRLTHGQCSSEKDFVEQIQKDVETSKNLMQLINNNDWEGARKINLDSSALWRF